MSALWVINSLPMSLGIVVKVEYKVGGYFMAVISNVLLRQVTSSNKEVSLKQEPNLSYYDGY